MMSERKRKQKWSLNPRGKAWSENTNKFGQKLMEKMGWSSGKGLGANEDGMTEHIRVAYKNDTQGMGFKGTDDKWTEHESKFTELLNTLAGPESENKNEVKIESSEKKSETSKARVHYRKFTRGKDLSRYSEKDLANIFGKKSLKEVLKPENVKEEIEDEKENVDDKSFGVVTHNGGSMLDYFKNKLPNFKNNSSKIAPEVSNDDNESDTERPSFGFGFSGSGNQNDNGLDQTEKTSFGLGFNGSENQNNSLDESKTVSKKFEKKKKNDPTDNFRKQCFGLGYDRYNGDESKPKGNYMSFVKATDTTEKKKPLKYGITKFVVSEDKTGAVNSEKNVTSENSDKNKLQTVFMSFVKGSDANESKDDDSSGKKIKSKKRKNKNEDCDNDDADEGKTKKLKIDESESTLVSNPELMNKKKDKNIKPTFVSFIKENVDVDNGGEESMKKNKKSKKDKSKKEQSSDKSIETSVVEENEVSNSDVLDSSISKKTKKDKKSKKDKVDDSLDHNEIEEVGSSKKGKKRKSGGELDVAFTPMKKKFKNFEDLHTLQGEEKIVETPDKKSKKSKKVKNSNELQNGLDNPAFDPLHNKITVQKHHLDAIVEESENSVYISEIKEDTEEKECEKVKSEKKKKKKAKSIEGIDNPCIEEISTLDQTAQSIDDTIVSESPKKKKSKKSKKEKEISTNGIENTAFDENSVNGLENSAFNDSNVESMDATESKYEIKEKKRKRKEIQANVDVCSEDSVNVEKKKKKKKNKVNETEGDSELNQLELKNEETLKKIKKKKNEILSIENPCFNSDDSLVSSEVVTPNKYEVKRSKKVKNTGIVNPGLDLTSPPPTENGTAVEDLPVMDDSLMLNVVCTPIIKKDKNDKKLQRRKSVRFSDVNQSIFINNTDSPSDLRKNGGVDNAAYDQFGNRIEEQIDTLNKQLDDFQAEVENDLNEAKVQVMVGEVGDPDGENEIMSNGEVKLKFKYANFGKMPPWMRKNNGMNPKSSYRHLIKGDIILGFKNTNMHDIKGYNEHLKSGSP